MKNEVITEHQVQTILSFLKEKSDNKNTFKMVEYYEKCDIIKLYPGSVRLRHTFLNVVANLNHLKVYKTTTSKGAQDNRLQQMIYRVTPTNIK